MASAAGYVPGDKDYDDAFTVVDESDRLGPGEGNAYGSGQGSAGQQCGQEAKRSVFDCGQVVIPSHDGKEDSDVRCQLGCQADGIH